MRASIAAFVIVVTLSIFLQQHIPVYKLAVKTEVDSSFLFVGDFTDDYGIKYTINDSVWLQYPNTKYQIIHWDKKQKCIIARNADSNPTDAGLYSRIDYMEFKNMQPFTWGFCYTIYNAESEISAWQTIAADSHNPKKGCNGFPYSRMKKTSK